MGKFIKENLPEPVSYFEAEGLKLNGQGKWRTTECRFHGGSDSMRVHLERGAFICMSCGAKGGDVLAYHQAAHGLGFIDAAKMLGAYQEDGKTHQGSTRPTPIPARVLLESVAHELTLASLIASDMAKGCEVSTEDCDRLLQAAGRIGYIAGIANAK
jgi:hypothetical protein